MQSNKHIVFVTPGFAKDEADTTCLSYLQDFLKVFRKARPDIRISVVTMQYPFKRGKYDWNGVEISAIAGKNRRWAKPLTWWRTVKEIRALHRLQPITLIHSFWLGEATLVAAYAAKKLAVAHFATCMGQDAFPTNRYLKYIALDRLQLIAVSEYNAALIQQAKACTVAAIIPFGNNEEDIDASENSDRPIHVLGVGSLIAVKRYDRFVRIVKLLSEQIPQLRAVLIGDGPERQKLQQLVQQFGLEKNLILRGSLPRKEVLEEMSRAQVFVHTSQTEGTGLVLLEVLSRGAHLVTTPVGIGASLPESQAAEKVVVSESTFGLYQAALHFLQKPVDWKERVIFRTADIVQQHLEIYRLGE